MVSLSTALALMVCSAGGQTVLLDFYSDQCAPCRATAPAVDQLIAKGYPVQRVNTQQDPALARQYGVTNIPCFVMLVDGREVDRIVGQQTFGRLEQMCKAGQAAPPTVPDIAATAPRGAARDPFSDRMGSPPAVVATETLPRNRPAPADDSIPLTETAAANEAFLSATVRIRIEDPNGASKGTGTIIDAREGEALALTCAHIFRDSQGKGRVEVDLFGAGAAQRVPATLIDFDLKNDVALVSFRVPKAVKPSRVAPAGYRVGPGDPAVSLGCSHGADPTVVRTRITAVDRYTNWPNLTTNTESVEGRSGGGLFTDDGLVIGVCNARDPQLREGLYSSLPAIHGIIDRNKLSFVYRGNDTPVAAAPRPAPGLETPPLARTRPAPLERPGELPVRPAVARTASNAQLAPQEQAAIDEISRRMSQGAEIIVMVRPNDPAAPSEVFMLNKVSSGFFPNLYAQTRQAAPPTDAFDRTRIEETATRVSNASNAKAGGPTTPVTPVVRGQR